MTVHAGQKRRHVRLSGGVAAAPPTFPYTATTLNPGGGFVGNVSAPGGTSPTGAAVKRFTETSVQTDWYMTSAMPDSAGKTVTWAAEFKLDPAASHSTADSVRMEASAAGAITDYFTVTTGAPTAGSGTSTFNVVDLGSGWKRFEIVYAGFAGNTTPAIEMTKANTSNYLGVAGKFYDFGAVGYKQV